jgi:hypothetical protein
VDADSPGQPRLWIDVESSMDWLPPEPYLIETAHLSPTIEKLEASGFRVVRIGLGEVGQDIEEKMLIDLSRKLGFSLLGAGSWAAFNDRLWDLLTAEDEPPVAIVIEGFSRLLEANVHAFVRCVHNLLSMTEGVGLADVRAGLQVEYFFVGEWKIPRHSRT